VTEHKKLSALIPAISAAVFILAFVYYFQALDIGKLTIETDFKYSTPKSIQLDSSGERPATESRVVPINQKAIDRILWGISCIALTSACILSLITSILTIHKTTKSLRTGFRVSLYVSMAILTIALATLATTSALSGGIGSSLYPLVKSETCLDTATPIDVTTMIISITSLFIACSCICLSLTPKEENFDQLSGNVNLYNMSAITTAIALSCGIIQIYCLYKFHSDYIDNPDQRKIILHGMTFSVSIFYALFFSLIYSPTLYVLRQRSIGLIASDSTQEPDKEGELKKRGINFTTKQIGKYVSLFISPIVVGFLTKIIESNLH